jgi:predicted membrane-bound spermidine synthase
VRRTSLVFKANATVFISSFGVMVIELIAARILAPYIGVSLYTWTSIIGVILAGIALGNYLGGRLADRYPLPLMLVAIFCAGSLLTVAIPPVTKVVASAVWFKSLPLMLSFSLRTFCIFFFPAVVLSMVSPLVIKLTLEDLGQTGGVVGTIYAFSTVGSIGGTFTTGFYFIPTFGIRTLVWYVGGILLLMGILCLFIWRVPYGWRPAPRTIGVWLVTVLAIIAFALAFLFRGTWQPSYTAESSYYTINVTHDVPNPDGINPDVRVLYLDRLIHGYVNLDDPLYLRYESLKTFSEIVGYVSGDDPAPRILHLGGGSYSFPRYVEAVYPQGTNDVVEIDPMVTRVAQQQLGLSENTSIHTFNQDARLFLIEREPGTKYAFVIGDVFNDSQIPYHLTTLEFDRLVKANMQTDGVYLVNIIDDFQQGRFMPAFINTLEHAFNYVYLFGTSDNWDNMALNTFVIAASNKRLDLTDYMKFVTEDGQKRPSGYPYDPAKLEEYLAKKSPVLLTDDYAPTDIMMAPIIR